MIGGPSRGQKRILLIVEGERTEPRLLSALLRAFGLAEERSIVSLGINIHDMLQKLQRGYGADLEDIDLPAALSDLYPEHAHVLSQEFTDTLLVFDFDPHDDRMDSEFLKAFQHAFNDSTDRGQLYLSYPSIESYRDFQQFGDESFLDSIVSLQDIEHGQGYKAIVGRRRNGLENVDSINPLQWVQVIAMHVSKLQHLLDGMPVYESAYWNRSGSLSASGIEMANILPALLEVEQEALKSRGAVYTCCTCLLFVCSWRKSIDGIWRKV